MTARVVVLLCGAFVALTASCASAPRESAVKATEPWVYLHLVSDRAAVLQRLMDDEWTSVCPAPCHSAVPTSGRFRILADVPSQPFSIPGATGSTVTLRMDADGHVYTLDSTRPAL